MSRAIRSYTRSHTPRASRQLFLAVKSSCTSSSRNPLLSLSNTSKDKMFVSIWVTIGLVVILMVLNWFNAQKAKIDRMKRLIGHIPGPKPNKFFGNIPDVLAKKGDYGRGFDQYIPKYGEVFSFYGFIPDVVISNPEHIKQMFQVSNDRGSAMVEPFIDTTQINGLFSMGYGDKWKWRRRIISPIFQNTNLSKTDWIMVEKVQKLAQRWKTLAKNGPAEIQSWHEFQKLTVDAIGHAAFGYDFKSIEGDSNKQLLQSMDLLFDIAVKRIIYASTPYWEWLPFLPENKKLAAARDLVKNTISKLIETKVENYKKQKAAGTLNEDRFDLLDLLLRASQDDSEGQISVDDLYSECMTFMIAGNETTAITLTFLFNVLGNHLTEQQKLRDEIKKAIGTKVPTMADLNAIPYLDMVIKESMRFNTVSYLMRRELTEDLKVGQYMVPKGAALVCSTEYLHMDERFWKEPKKFNPERFTKEEEEKRPMYTYIPFGGGLRICVGKTFAMTEIKFATAMLLREFEIDARKHGPSGSVQQFVTKPDSPCPCTIKPLN